MMCCPALLSRNAYGLTWSGTGDPHGTGSSSRSGERAPERTIYGQLVAALHRSRRFKSHLPDAENLRSIARRSASSATRSTFLGHDSRRFQSGSAESTIFPVTISRRPRDVAPLVPITPGALVVLLALRHELFEGLDPAGAHEVEALLPEGFVTRVDARQAKDLRGSHGTACLEDAVVDGLELLAFL
jgi:hypothetical protein